MTQPGQTDNYGISDHIDAIIEHAGEGIVDYCICDTGEIVPEFVRMYNKRGSDTVEQDLQNVRNRNITIIQKDLSIIDGELIRHDADMVASTIMELICTDLKFKDKQYDPQYILLNSKLKDQKKKEKHKEKENKTNKKQNNRVNKKVSKREKTKSRFSEKYSERIRDIKASDRSRQRNRELFEETGSLYSREKKDKE